MRSCAQLRPHGRAVTRSCAQFGTQLRTNVCGVERAVMVRWALSYAQIRPDGRACTRSYEELRGVTRSYAQLCAVGRAFGLEVTLRCARS